MDCCAGLLLALPAIASAATFPDLYVVSVAPDDAASNSRADAIQRGMRLLLTRITGRQQAADYPGAEQLIRNADRYLSLYAPLSEEEIRVGFIRGAVNDELTRLEMPIWGDERPLTLLWLAAEFPDGQRAELQAAEEGGPRAGAVAGAASNPLDGEAAELFDSVATEILTAADERGLPVVLPLLDPEDRRHVRFADVWGGFDRVVARAAERYQADTVMIVRIVATDFGPELDWIVQRGDRVETLTTPRARLGVDWLADEFASEFTTVGGASLAWVTVRDIRNWPDLGRVLEYLDSVSIIESVDIDSMDGTDLLLRIAARGGDSQLARYLTLDGELTEDETADGLVFVPSWRTAAIAPDAR
ncbi:MAG: DUF2066 domain-containing protein [Gammaproteobacteria bacterium]|jgi:hypothetical protein